MFSLKCGIDTDIRFLAMRREISRAMRVITYAFNPSKANSPPANFKFLFQLIYTYQEVGELSEEIL